MQYIQTNALLVAQQYLGMREIVGSMNSPVIMSMLTLDAKWPQNDEVPWCSAFVNWIAFQLNLPRSKSLSARSWLKVGVKLEGLAQVDPGLDVVVLSRGGGPQPGPEVLDAPGHVGFVWSVGGTTISVLGGNQSNAVTIETFSASRILGLRRLQT